MNWLRSRVLFIAVTALCAVLVLPDFSTRVFVGRDSSLRAFKSPDLVVLTAVVSKAKAVESLNVWLPKKVADAAVSKPREIVLQGTFVFAGQARAALSLVSPAGLPPQRFKAVVGDVVEGWTVAAIEIRKIVLRRGDESRELSMFRRR